MKKLSYYLLLLLLVPVVAIASDSNSITAEKDLGYIGKVSETELIMSDEEIDEALKEEVVEEEDEALVSLDTPKISSEVRNWRKNLEDKDRQLFKKLMKRKRRKDSSFHVSSLTLPQAKKILRRAKDREKLQESQSKLDTTR